MQCYLSSVLPAFSLRLLVLAALVSSAACRLGDDVSGFIVRVDSIGAPNSIRSADTLAIRFWGSVGPDQCSRLIGVERAGGPGLLRIAFRGERKSGNCAQMPVSLQHIERVAPPLADPFRIEVRQPDGEILSSTVIVQ
ncbi:MAG: hypothetical protein ACT4OZ_08200 [Gemmatimonadota bacterium]